MRHYLAALGVFVSGQFILLIVFLFFPALNTAGTQLATDTAGIAPFFWGWTWVVGSVRMWVWLAIEATILFATAKAFLASRRR